MTILLALRNNSKKSEWFSEKEENREILNTIQFRIFILSCPIYNTKDSDMKDHIHNFTFCFTQV